MKDTICPYCGEDRRLEDVTTGPKDPKRPTRRVFFCGNCARTFKIVEDV